MTTTTSIMTSGIELTDDELKALSIDVMCVWLDMWREARDNEVAELETWVTEEHDEPESYYEAIGIDDFDAYYDR
jgi:hypothetical protein